jgi:hypothetical protein
MPSPPLRVLCNWRSVDSQRGSKGVRSQNLQVPYHQQNTGDYCGPACAEMVLSFLRGTLLQQEDLFNQICSYNIHENGWVTDPAGLLGVLNNPPSLSSLPARFSLDALESEDAVSRKICWTIHASSQRDALAIAPIALVLDKTHWVVVRGYTATAEPGCPSDTGYAIDSFDINDPSPQVPVSDPPPPPPPHDPDDGCGDGGARGTPNGNVSYGTWRDTYLARVNSGYWQGKFVALCNTDPPSNAAASTGEIALGDVAPGDGRLLRAESIAEVAVMEMKARGLLERSAWAEAFGGRPGRPILVQRLDRLDSFYYLVPFDGSDGAPGGAVAVDARYGNYRQSVVFTQKERRGFRQFEELENVAEHVVDRQFELDKPGRRLFVRREALCVHPTAVWRTCAESLSPLDPFYMVSYGAHRFFIRARDGARFSKLTVGLYGL